MSLVLRLDYGETSFLFTGDAERGEEQDLLAAGRPLGCTVLKVGHHGSATSTTYPFLRAVMPQFAVISAGADNPYGDPTDEVLSRLRDAGTTVFRTDLQGDIECRSDGKTVTFTVQKNADTDTLAPRLAQLPQLTQAPAADSGTAQPEAQAYVLNTNTHKFHYPWCPSVKRIKDKNRQDYTGTRDELIAQGFDPCGRCTP